jgi:hypothetical protein
MKKAEKKFAEWIRADRSAHCRHNTLNNPSEHLFGISTSINVMTGAKSYTKAMLIARSRLNEFRVARMRGPISPWSP